MFLLPTVVIAGCTSKAKQAERCCTTEDSDASVSRNLGKVLAEFNRGAAFLEQYQYGKAATAFETVLNTVPDWTAARFNLGLAYFNMQAEPGAKEYLELAREAFEAVLQADPNHLHARFCLGLYYQHLGKDQEALGCFRAVHQADREDRYTGYKYAETLLGSGSVEDGTKMLETVVSMDPGFISAIYRLAMQYQLTKQHEKAKALLTRFKDLKDAELTGGSFCCSQGVRNGGQILHGSRSWRSAAAIGAIFRTGTYSF